MLRYHRKAACPRRDRLRFSACRRNGRLDDQCVGRRGEAPCLRAADPLIPLTRCQDRNCPCRLRRGIAAVACGRSCRLFHGTLPICDQPPLAAPSCAPALGFSGSHRRARRGSRLVDVSGCAGLDGDEAHALSKLYRALAGCRFNFLSCERSRRGRGQARRRMSCCGERKMWVIVCVDGGRWMKKL